MPYTIYTMAIINNLGSIMSNIQGTMSRYEEDVTDVEKSDLSELVRMPTNGSLNFFFFFFGWRFEIRDFPHTLCVS